MSAPHTPEPPDDLKQRYLQASADQTIGPSERVRRAALAHAKAVADGVTATAPVDLPLAANRARWNVPLVASLAIASISALLALQFDRSDPADKAVVLSIPSVTAPAATSAPAPASTSTSTAPTAAPVAKPAPASDQATPPPNLTPPGATSAKRAKEPNAAVAQSAAPAPAPAAAEPSTATREPPPALASSPAAKSISGSGANSNSNSNASVPSAAAEKAEANGLADRASIARPAPANQKDTQKNTQNNPQNRAAPSADAERGAPAAARSESASAESSAAARSRAAAAPGSGPTPAPPMAAPQAAAPGPAPAPSTSAPPIDAGTALREAARTGQLGALTQALQTVTAAQLNSTDSAGRTALMLATLRNHAESVQRLINAGANAELKDASGETALQMAKRLGSKQIEAILKSP